MGNKKILIVDDDPEVLQSMHLRLKANHYDTFFAADAMCAITEARKCLPDVIVLDLGLPAGDGFVVLERLRVNMQLAMIPVIVVSGRDLPANKERALQLGAKAFIQKPWNDNELLALIGKLSGQPEVSISQPK